MQHRPAAVVLYRAYCYLNVILNALSVYAGFWMIRAKDQLGAGNVEWPPEVWPMLGLVLIIVGLVFTIGSVVVLFLPDRPWAWTVHLVNLILGVAGCVTAVFCIPLAIVWFRPDVKHYFGVDRGEYPRSGR